MNSLKFEGKGLTFFKIHFVNVILTIFSLTLLYPWSKVREIKFFCQNLSMAGLPFTFTGNTGTFFKGYLKTFAIYLCIYLLIIAGAFFGTANRDSLAAPVVLFVTAMVGVTLLYLFIPVVLHGSINYRLDFTFWGNIKPSYTGKISELVRVYFTGAVLTTLTAGIYQAWFQVKLTKYLLTHFHFGSLRFDFSGDAKTLFLLMLKGSLLSLITLGIYSIWFFKELYEYSVDNIVVRKDGQEFKLHSDANILEVFEMMVGNLLWIVLTLGIGASWAYMRYYSFITNHCVIPSEFNFSSIDEPLEEEAEKPSQHWLDKWNPKLIA